MIVASRPVSRRLWKEKRSHRAGRARRRMAATGRPMSFPVRGAGLTEAVAAHRGGNDGARQRRSNFGAFGQPVAERAKRGGVHRKAPTTGSHQENRPRRCGNAQSMPTGCAL